VLSVGLHDIAQRDVVEEKWDTADLKVLVLFAGSYWRA
jgi:hypothetical protein